MISTLAVICIIAFVSLGFNIIGLVVNYFNNNFKSTLYFSFILFLLAVSITHVAFTLGEALSK
jgi:hypothetical protein